MTDTDTNGMNRYAALIRAMCDNREWISPSHVQPLLDERERLLAIATAAKALVHAMVTPPEDDPAFAGSYWWSRETEKLAEELVLVVNGGDPKEEA